MTKTRSRGKPLIERLADDLEGDTKTALQVIAPLLYDVDENTLAKVADVLADYAIAVVKTTLTHVAPYREV